MKKNLKRQVGILLLSITVAGAMPMGVMASRLEVKTQQNTRVKVKKATTAVKLAEATKRASYINDAKEQVNGLVDSPEKTDLLSRISSIELEIGRVLEESSLKEVTTAVQLAETTKRTAHIDSAKEKLGELSNSDSKMELEERLLQLEMANVNSSSELRKARNSLNLAKKLKKDIYIDRAENDINKLNPSDEKTELLIELNEIKMIGLTHEKFEDNDVLVIKTIQAVEMAEKYRYEMLHTKASKMVDLIKSQELKSSLRLRLDAIVLK